jgi:mono/diheme cytochrome c family protein
VGPGWTFLRGDKADVKLLRRKLGLLDDEPDSAELENHDLNIRIGNQRTGTWLKVTPYDNPHLIASRIGRWLDNWRQPSTRRNSYADAPALRSISSGEGLFRTRCSACHALGGERVTGAPTALAPDLLGVTRRRDRAWLARFVKEPDRMIAEKDPLAMTLLAQYDDLAMPNMRLSDDEVAELLSYLEEESRRLEAPAPARESGLPRPGALRVSRPRRRQRRQRRGRTCMPPAAIWAANDW